MCLVCGIEQRAPIAPLTRGPRTKEQTRRPNESKAPTMGGHTRSLSFPGFVRLIKIREKRDICDHSIIPSYRIVACDIAIS